MAMIPAKCHRCGKNITVDDTKKAGLCEYCDAPFLTEILLDKSSNSRQPAKTASTSAATATPAKREFSKYEQKLEDMQNAKAEKAARAKKSSFLKISAKLLIKGIDKYLEWQDKREEKQWEKLEKQTEKEIERLIKQADKEMLASTSAKEATQKVTSRASETNLVESWINTDINKAYFDNGVVYVITEYGEAKAGYYDDTRVYDENKDEIASLTHCGDDIIIRFNHLGQIAYIEKLHAKIAEETPHLKETCEESCRKECAKLLTFERAVATNGGYIEDDNWEKIAYLIHRSYDDSKERILGLAAAFVCLQKFVWSDENKYSRFYR